MRATYNDLSRSRLKCMGFRRMIHYPKNVENKEEENEKLKVYNIFLEISIHT